MHKAVTCILIAIFSAVPAFASDISGLIHTTFCSDMVNKIDRAGIDIKMNEASWRDFLKQNRTEKDYSKKMELHKNIAEYEDKIKSDTAHLANLMTIYKATGCDMVEAMKHIYCPENWSKDCDWVYGKVSK